MSLQNLSVGKFANKSSGSDEWLALAGLLRKVVDSAGR
jgi:hypothetical protein